METLTLFINDLYDFNKVDLGEETYQTIQGRNIISETYKDLVISGSLIQEVVFEEVIFENCTFFATEIENTLFIDCLFINCTFQFSRISDCNFENTALENCKWVFTKLVNTEIEENHSRNNVSYFSDKTNSHSIFDLNIFLGLTA